MQRSYTDAVPVCSTTGTITVAQLSQFVPISFGGSTSNTVDAALAQTIAGEVDPAGRILGIGTVSTTTVAPKLGLHVEKAGRTTGLTSGNIDSVNVTVTVNYAVQCGSTTNKPARFINQFTILPLNVVGRGGDSGSLIVKTVATGKSPNPVGLLFAVDDAGRSLANPISTVLTSLGRFVGSPVSFVGTAANASELAALAAERPDPEVEAVSQVKDRYDDFLLRLPEVVGHGVPYSHSGSGRVVIRLFVRKATDAVRRALPISLEGVPVEMEETGEYRAIPACAVARER
jgi:hypothetical protein